MKPKVFILILNYKKTKDTIACLEALSQSDLPDGTQLVVLDNSYPFSKAESAVKALYPDIHVINHPYNLGFAAGNNPGIKYALKHHATHILIINPDVRVPSKFLPKLLSTFQKDSRIGIVAPLHKHLQKNRLTYGLGGTVDWRTSKCIHENHHSVTQKEPLPYEFVSFACVLIKREVITKVGLLDEQYFMYLEDVDYCLKAKSSGYLSFINPTVVVTHNTSSSFNKPTDKLIISFLSQVKFINSHYPLLKRLYPLFFMFLFYPYLYLLWTYHHYKHRPSSA